MLFLSFFIHSRAVHMLSILCDIHLSGRGSLFILSSLTTFMTLINKQSTNTEGFPIPFYSRTVLFPLSPPLFPSSNSQFTWLRQTHSSNLSRLPDTDTTPLPRSRGVRPPLDRRNERILSPRVVAVVGFQRKWIRARLLPCGLRLTLVDCFTRSMEPRNHPLCSYNSDNRTCR